MSAGWTIVVGASGIMLVLFGSIAVVEVRAMMAKKQSAKRVREQERGDSLNRRIKNAIIFHQSDCSHGTPPATEVCHICKKRDFADNLADVSWMVYEDERGEPMPKGWYYVAINAHPECAKIKRSDDGQGWVRLKK